MNRDSWLKIRKLFEEAFDLPSDARNEYLLQACGEDVSLRKEVEKLLAAHREDSYLEPPQEFTGNSLLDNAARASSPPPERVGKYRLLECIGSGGMGQIYRAVRDDREYEKEVAVKLIKRGMDTEEILRRFRTERQTLASLDHPNIARLLDGGTTRDGLPYLVMEYVNGVPIDKYCDREKLSIVARLRLFRQVCSAVEYAHRNLIVHRDIKPGNILVTPEGIPKLLDFGIAKLLGNESSGMTVTTVSSMKMMTPRYASPEQIMGRAMTTATDVYSLGVVLYELLTGRSPYSCETQSRNSIERQIIQSDPERPSASVRRDTTTLEGETTVASIEAVCASRNITRDKLRKLLKRDLDTIVMTALHRETERRYASVEQLSEDIRRYLGGLPIVAEADSLGYVASKFIIRHKSVVTVSVLAFLILVAGVIGTTTAMFRAQKAALVAENATAKANSELKKANEIRQFLQDMLAAANPENEGRDVTVREVLDQASKRVDTELGSEPAVCEAVHRTIGQTYLGLGLYEEARFHLEKADEICKEIYGSESIEYARSNDDLVAALMMFKYKYRLGKVILQNIELYQKILGENNIESARRYAAYGAFLSKYHKYQDAIEVYRQSFSMFEQLGLKPTYDELEGFGKALSSAGYFIEGKEMLDLSLETAIKANGYESVSVAGILHSMAVHHDNLGEFEKSEALFREVLRIRTKLFGADDLRLPVTILSIADIMYITGRFEEAASWYHRAWLIRSGWKEGYGAKLLIKESLAHRASDNRNDYVSLWRAGLNEFQVYWDATAWNIQCEMWIKSFKDLATVHFINGNLDLADDRCQDAIEYTLAVFNSFTEKDYSEMLLFSAMVYLNRSDYFKAEYCVKEVLSECEYRLWEKHWLVGESLYYWGLIKIAQLNPMAAIVSLRKALDIFSAALPEDHRLIACTRSSLGQCLVFLGQYNEAKAHLEECIPNLEKVLGHRDLPTKLGIQKREAERQLAAAIKSLIVACEKTGDGQGVAKWREALKTLPVINETGVGKTKSRSIPLSIDWWKSVGF